MASFDSEDEELNEDITDDIGIEDLDVSDVEESSSDVYLKEKQIIIDLNSRICKSKSEETANIDSDSCTTQFQVSDNDFKSPSKEVDLVASDSEDLEIPDDDVQVVSGISMKVNAVDFESFANIETENYSCETFGNIDSASTDPIMKRLLNAKKKIFYATLGTVKFARSTFKPADKSDNLLQGIADEDDEVFFCNDFDLDPSHSSQIEFMKFKSNDGDGTDSEELVINDGQGLESNTLRHRRDSSNPPKLANATHFHSKNVDACADDENETTRLVRKLRKSQIKTSDRNKHSSDEGSTEEEDLNDLDTNQTGKLKEWSETDESGGVTQVTQIKTETSIKVIGDDEECDDGMSHTTTTTTRITTTVTTNDGDEQPHEPEGESELRRSMEEVLNQFMTEDSSSGKH